MTLRDFLLPIGLVVGLVGACFEPGVEEEDCQTGSHGCSCTSGDACNDGLVCVLDICIAQNEVETDGEPTTGDGDGDGSGDGDGDGDGDGEPLSCYEIDNQAACDANPECFSIVGWEVRMEGLNSPCRMQPKAFMECVYMPMNPCTEVESVFCAADVGYFVLETSCGPTFLQQCGGSYPNYCP